MEMTRVTADETTQREHDGRLTGGKKSIEALPCIAYHDILGQGPAIEPGNMENMGQRAISTNIRNNCSLAPITGLYGFLL